jgi:hypothetical protein
MSISTFGGRAHDQKLSSLPAPLSKEERAALRNFSNKIEQAVGPNADKSGKESNGHAADSIKRTLRFDVSAETYRMALESDEGNEMLLGQLQKLVDCREWEGIFMLLTFRKCSDMDPIGRALNKSENASILLEMMEKLPWDLQKRLEEFNYDCYLKDGRMQVRGLFSDGLCVS